MKKIICVLFLLTLILSFTYSGMPALGESEFVEPLTAAEAMPAAIALHTHTIGSGELTSESLKWPSCDIPHYTMSGLEVAHSYAIREMSEQEKGNASSTMTSNYGPYILEMLQEPTARYNCHSYAWFFTSTLNDTWLDNIQPYLSDPHCVEIINPVVGAVVVYYVDGSPAHSAVITGINGNVITCVSKWSYCGLYKHFYDNVPAEYLDDGVPNCRFFRYPVHSYSIVSSYNATTHTLKCAYCASTTTAAHVAKASGKGCIICPYSGIISVTPSKRPMIVEPDEAQ